MELKVVCIICILQGAFTFHGNMVDRPLLLQARNIIQTMQNIKRL
jgi:citrate lyase beta subunit